MINPMVGDQSKFTPTTVVRRVTYPTSKASFTFNRIKAPRAEGTAEIVLINFRNLLLSASACIKLVTRVHISDL